MDSYYQSDECNVDSVKRVILSVGTNDIRYCRSGVGHLYYPILNLVNKIKTYFPDATVFVQSLLPIRYNAMRPENPHVVRNVTELNKLLIKAAANIGDCFYFDICDKYYDRRNGVPIDRLYRDNVHLSRSGLSILAKAYIQIIRGRNNSVINLNI